MANQPLYCTPVQFENLLELVKNAGYKLLGPKLRDEVIIYDELHSAKDLPIGWTDEQDPGRYRLKRRNDNAYFGYNLGPHSWKKFLFPPREKLWSAKKQDNKLVILQEMAPPDEKMAFIGVRACEIQAIVVLDKVFNTKLAVYQQYQRRRESTFIISVNCTTCVNTCFCASMQAGPHVKEGYDLSLTEVIDERQHYFLFEIGTKRGQAISDALQLRPATETERDLAYKHVERTIEKMIRKVDNANVHALLENSHDYKRWDEVATRCINCANCTNSCPTCFCSDTEDIVNVDATHVDRWQSWESCFNLSHSYIHGGSIRNSAQSRYRQWLTHKFGTWWDQFGVSGCVGCGRCITWCPVGIDVTEELKQLQIEHDQKNR
jgi:formate hydrogenlyase subunit 6/NADH:ubiquinone oxidoreductase subunit I